jgi:hypothetical protein
MQHSLINDKFPVYSLEIPKSETSYQNTDQMIDSLKTKIEAHPVARFIAVFDHYGHVKAQKKGEIAPGILNSKNILFCMSAAIPNAMIAALRPRSIAVNELADKFVVNFMEAPMEVPTKTMIDWVSSLKNQ